MAIHCPHCSFEMEVTGIRAGRFTPTCQQCAKAFVLVVSDDAAAKMTVLTVEQAEALAGTLPQAITPPKPAQSRGRPAQRRPDPKPRPKPVVPASAEETIPVSRGAPPAHPARQAPPASPVSGRATLPSRGAHDRTIAQHKAALRATLPQVSVPKKLGGYEIIRELGRGAMGSVYLARQVSLDRLVAIKVMNPEWADDPLFLSRFCREAYASAQLVHHNVVQIYDIGTEGDRTFFSMEYVEGETLAELLASKQRLSTREAAGFSLQAARGLKFAHERGMIHRDVKPDNLMLNRLGIVKVADLGLVKTPEMPDEETGRSGGNGEGAPAPGARDSGGANLTRVDQAMGTPAFMSPEQARDAAHVDQRSDIYSLGCTIYYLITGRPVFEGDSAEEVMTKQVSHAAMRPDAVVTDIPGEMADIVMKMLAKDPADRYQNLDGVIVALESFLGVSTAATFRPEDEHAETVMKSAAAYRESAAAKFRGVAAMALLVVCITLVFGLLVMASPRAAAACLGAIGFMPGWYFLITGLRRKTHLFSKVRAYLLGATWRDWTKAGIGLVLLIALCVVFNLHWVMLGSLIASGLIATGFHGIVDSMVEADRREPVEAVGKVLRSMRFSGVDEDELHRFVCFFGGDDWEGIYEAIFGYESKLIARRRWGAGEHGRLRPKYGAWRDGIVERIDNRLRLRKRERDRKYLAVVERKALIAKGVSELTALRQAQRAAEEIVTRAAATRASQPGYRGPISEPSHSNLPAMLLGSRTRALLGLILVVACATWMHQNDLIPGKELKELGRQSLNKGQLAGEDQLKDALAENLDVRGKKFKPLAVPFLPDASTAWVNSYNPGVAGVILLFSGFFAGIRMTLLIIPGIVVMLLGHQWGIPAIGPVPEEYMSMAAGSIVCVLAIWFGRYRD